MTKIKFSEIVNIYKGISCVYRIQFVDGTFYIGSTTCLKRRMSLHLFMLRSNNQTTFYGKLNTREINYVGIVQRVDNKRELRLAENRLIKKCKHNSKLLNIPSRKGFEGVNLMSEILKNRTKTAPSLVNVTR